VVNREDTIIVDGISTRGSTLHVGAAIIAGLFASGYPTVLASLKLREMVMRARTDLSSAFSVSIQILPIAMTLALWLFIQDQLSGDPLFTQLTRLAQSGGPAMSDFPFLYVAVNEPPAQLRQNAKQLAEEGGLRMESLEKRPVFSMPGSRALADAPSSLREQAPIPAYLPPNIRNEGALISEHFPSPEESRPTLILRYPGSSDQPMVSLIIVQHPAPPYEIWPLQVPVQRGFFHPVIYPPLRGYLIRGAWAVSMDPHSGQARVDWGEEVAISLVFLRGEDVITVLGQPAYAFSEQELVAVALSLID